MAVAQMYLVSPNLSENMINGLNLIDPHRLCYVTWSKSHSFTKFLKKTAYSMNGSTKIKFFFQVDFARFSEEMLS